MTKTTQRTAKPGMGSLPFPQIDVAAFNSNMISAYAKASQEFFENALTLNQEMMRFATERLEANAHVLQELPKCGSWDRALTVQSEFARSSAEACFAEMPLLTEQAARTCTALWAPVLESVQSVPEAAEKS